MGRARGLTGSIIIDSVFTAACGLSETIGQLAIFRVLLGLGMGGEWATGAALVAETWPAAHRGKALGLVQSAWAIGYALAAMIAALVLPRWGWRVVFFVGILPAIVTIWIQRSIEEPEIWRQSRANPTPHAGVGSLFSGPLGRVALAITLMSAGTMFAWWGFNLWIPAYLSLPANEGGIGLTAVQMSLFVFVMQVGMWLGYVTYGFIGDSVGRKPTSIGYLAVAAGLLPLSAVVHRPIVLLLGPSSRSSGPATFPVSGR